MKTILITLLSVSLLLYSCYFDDNKKSKAAIYHKTPGAPITGKDTLLVDTKSAISILLDSSALEKNKKKYGDTAVDAYTEDGSYYDYLADSILKQKKLPIIQAINYRYVKFVQKNGAITLIRIDTLSQVSTFYFFDPNKPPHIADVTDIEHDYNSFYR